MELSTHLSFSIAVGLVFFGKPEIALLMGLGALMPDLDREYWFMPWKWYRDEQYHRALFHNVFLMAIAYIVNPFISLGMLLHVFQDSFTTVRDRGVEIFYPFTRLVKRGWLNGNYVEDEHPPEEHVFFYQEDVLGLVNDADPDLREEGSRPVPWRRIYGFALNGRLIDHWFLFGSLSLIGVWLSANWPMNLQSMSSYMAGETTWIVGYVAIALIFISGDLDRHDQYPAYPKLTPIKYPLIVVGLMALSFWIYLNLDRIVINVSVASQYFLLYVVSAFLIAITGAIVLYLEIGSRKNAIV